MTDKKYEKLKLMDLSEIQEFDWSELKAIDMNEIHARNDLSEFDWSELKSIDDLSEFDFKASDL